MPYEIQNGKINRTYRKEVSIEEAVKILNDQFHFEVGTPFVRSDISKPKLAFEDHDLGEPTSHNVRKCKEDETVPYGTGAAWDNGHGKWLYNWLGATEEAKFLGKRLPTDEEFTELLKSKSDMPNVVYAGLCNGGSCKYRGYYAYYWSASVCAPSPTTSWRRNLNYGNASVNRNSTAPAYAFSVRCLKD